MDRCISEVHSVKFCSSCCQCILLRMPPLSGAHFGVNYINSDEPIRRKLFLTHIFPQRWSN